VLSTGSGILSKDFLRKSEIVVDTWRMYEAWDSEVGSMEDGLREHPSNLAADMMELVKEGDLKVSEITNLGDVVAGHKTGRSNEEERIVCSMHGMVAEDKAWGFTVYQNALKMGLGTKPTFFEEGYRA
jgi:N-[(2S)-2-amino-2-carboxyethyl]-L-glutamate dehydrogenase